MSIETVKVGRRNDHAVLFHNGEGLGLSWSNSEQLYLSVKRLHKLCRLYENTGEISEALVAEKINKEVTIRRFGLMMFLEFKGRIWLEAPYEKMLEVVMSLYRLGKEIEEEKKAEQVIKDVVLAARARFPVAMSENKKILIEAQKQLGQFIPNTSIVNRPNIIVHPKEA